MRQHYRYTYTGPVWDLRQRLVMIPRDVHRDQRLLQHDLAVRGTEGDHRLTWERDEFGNRIARVVANRVPQAIDFEAVFRLERRSSSVMPEPPPWRNDAERLAYLRPTALTAPEKRLTDAALEIARKSADADERAELAHLWTAKAIAYQFGVTGYSTPAAMALHLGLGVCQDYAHILLTVLRLMNVPARYVSGHLIGEGAPHAWVEAFIERGPGAVEVIGFDPTHARRTRIDYLTVAVGRDFADVSPTSGTYGGPAQGRLAATKQAEVVELDVAGAAGAVA
ncbi:MAG TPA: transglutaminase family protein [Candidatus Limnocylindria bacterium]|nr:transglutaminase family protein [Candidatus Limnocylindria bacterium]